MQLDLFRDSQSEYYQAVEALERLDFASCRSNLERHRRRFPRGFDAGPTEEAALWLEGRLPSSGQGTAAGRRGLELIRTLLGGGPLPSELASLGEGSRQRIATNWAARCLALTQEENIEPSAPLAEGLPWGVFHLFAGQPGAARKALEVFLASANPSAAAYLALGDALWAEGKPHQALVAFREGYALDPCGAGWTVACLEVADSRQRLEAQWGLWWAVAAFLEGIFPAFGTAAPLELRSRWEKFLALRSTWLNGGGEGTRLFWTGLFLSQNAGQFMRLPKADLPLVRTTLRGVHEALWERHWENLRDAAAPTRRC